MYIHEEIYMYMYVHICIFMYMYIACTYMFMLVRNLVNMYIHVCTVYRDVCTDLPILVQVVRIPDEGQSGLRDQLLAVELWQAPASNQRAFSHKNRRGTQAVQV